MELSAKCCLALGHDMLSRPQRVCMDWVGPGLGRESMAPTLNGLLLIRARLFRGPAAILTWVCHQKWTRPRLELLI